VTDIIEPSVGNGSFLHHYRYKPNICYDIEPDYTYSDIVILKQDYLCAEIKYKRGRLIIGNPPYGERMHLAQMFFKKSVQIADYIAFVLPISQLNNTNSLYEFDLIYSEDLGIQNYSGIKLHCCFNIYSRPKNGLNKKCKQSLSDVCIYRQDQKGYDNKPFDIRMCYWGNGSAGKILREDEHYSAEYKILVLNDNLKNEIIDFLTNFDWKNYLNCISAKKIEKHHIITVLKENINGIK